MRRSKKSLGSAILVSLLSASMVMTTPVYALSISGEDKTIPKDVTDGLLVDEGANVTINGNVSDKDANEEETKRVTIEGGSTVTIKENIDATRVWVKEEGSSLTVNGDVKADGIKTSDANISVRGDAGGFITNHGGNITIAGSTNTKISFDDMAEGGDYAIIMSGGSTTVGKDVSVTTEAGGTGVLIDTTINDGQNKADKVDLNVAGDVNVTTEPNEGEGGYTAGINVSTNNTTAINVNIGGSVKVNSQDFAEGISTYIAPSTNAEDGASITIEAGGVDVKAPEEGDAVAVTIGNGNNTNTTIVIKGDVTSTRDGINIWNDGDGATTNIVVDGTLESNNKESGIIIFNRGKDNETNITAWKINNNTDKFDPVLVNRLEGDSKKGIADDAATKKQNENINYIIRHEGTISLEGTRTTEVNGNKFETARETEKLTIHVKVDDEKKYRVDRVEGGTATATKNADGSWTLIVPKNGGVDIRAVLVAIEQTKHNSSSSSGGGSSSSRPGVSNAASGMTTTTTDGATVQTNVIKNNNSATTTAAVRIGTTTANVTSSVSEQNGTKITFQNASGNLAGASFKTVGQVSADGTTLVKEDGTTAKMATGMLLSIENADGTSVGCFVDATGKTIATGNFEVYYMLGIDGKLHAHFVNPQGYFMTGIQVINGQTVTFNAVGEMVSVI